MSGRAGRHSSMGSMLTIFAIAGTLTSCGRYGSPVRPIPEAVVRLDGVQTDGQTDGLAPEDGRPAQDRPEKRSD